MGTQPPDPWCENWEDILDAEESSKKVPAPVNPKFTKGFKQENLFASNSYRQITDRVGVFQFADDQVADKVMEEDTVIQSQNVEAQKLKQ